MALIGQIYAAGDRAADPKKLRLPRPIFDCHSLPTANHRLRQLVILAHYATQHSPHKIVLPLRAMWPTNRAPPAVDAEPLGNRRFDRSNIHTRPANLQRPTHDATGHHHDHLVNSVFNPPTTSSDTTHGHKRRLPFEQGPKCSSVAKSFDSVAINIYT